MDPEPSSLMEEPLTGAVKINPVVKVTITLILDKVRPATLGYMSLANGGMKYIYYDANDPLLFFVVVVVVVVVVV